MPELPEVEVIRRELQPQLVGQIFESVEIFWPKSFEDRADQQIVGRSIVDIDRRGKYLIFVLDQGYLVVHLRMTGQLMFLPAIPPVHKHLQVLMQMRSGRYLAFFDSRKFGRVIHADHLNGVLKNTGIDALSPDLTLKKFSGMLKKQNRMIKSFLMDQRRIAGLGNIYVDESLFKAGIHPQAGTRNISGIKISRLFEAIRETLTQSIGNMGTTISDYKTVGGGFGGHQNYLQVYGREGESCMRCGKPIEKIRMNNRGTHFCPRCQKPQRR
jgi:formamidopyrimidine-DNA glycosylase